MPQDKVNIEDVFMVFQTFQAAQLHATKYLPHSLSEYNRIMNEARKIVQKFCEDNNLPIDFTPLS